MRGWNSCKRFPGIGVAIVLTLGAGGTVGLLAKWSLSPPSSARRVRPDDRREARPIAAELVTAIRNGDVQAVRKLLGGGADVNARDAEGNTPLILASLYASPECAELLIEKKAMIQQSRRNVLEAASILPFAAAGLTTGLPAFAQDPIARIGGPLFAGISLAPITYGVRSTESDASVPCMPR